MIWWFWQNLRWRRFTELGSRITRRRWWPIRLANRSYRRAALWWLTNHFWHIWRLNQTAHTNLKSMSGLSSCAINDKMSTFLFEIRQHISWKRAWSSGNLSRLAKKWRSRGSLTIYSGWRHFSAMLAASGRQVTARMSFTVFLLSATFLHYLWLSDQRNSTANDAVQFQQLTYKTMNERVN